MMDMRDGSYLRRVRSQYEHYPYPPRRPADERKKLIRTDLDYLAKINHYGFRGRQGFNGFRALVVGGGTGDATLFLGEQLRGKDAEIVHLDISRASRITDKMPQNFLHLGLIRQLFPVSRIIHCIRDPLDTGLSIYFQNFSDGLGYVFDLQNIGLFYQQYRRIMKFWLSNLGISVFNIRYEELVKNPESIIRRMIRFLGLEWDDRCLRFHESDRSVVTSSFQQVREPIYSRSVGRWKRYAPHIQPLIKTVQKGVSPAAM